VTKTGAACVATASRRRGRNGGLRPGLITVVLSLALCVVWGLTAPQVQAQPARDRLILGLPLEPPNLDPTSGAAAAVDEVVYANVFEGLTRLKADPGFQADFAKAKEEFDAARAAATEATAACPASLARQPW